MEMREEIKHVRNAKENQILSQLVGLLVKIWIAECLNVKMKCAIKLILMLGFHIQLLLIILKTVRINRLAVPTNVEWDCYKVRLMTIYSTSKISIKSELTVFHHSVQVFPEFAIYVIQIMFLYKCLISILMCISGTFINMTAFQK